MKRDSIERRFADALAGVRAGASPYNRQSTAVMLSVAHSVPFELRDARALARVPGPAQGYWRLQVRRLRLLRTFLRYGVSEEQVHGVVERHLGPLTFDDPSAIALRVGEARRLGQRRRALEAEEKALLGRRQTCSPLDKHAIAEIAVRIDRVREEREHIVEERARYRGLPEGPEWDELPMRETLAGFQRHGLVGDLTADLYGLAAARIPAERKRGRKTVVDPQDYNERALRLTARCLNEVLGVFFSKPMTAADVRSRLQARRAR